MPKTNTTRNEKMENEGIEKELKAGNEIVWNVAKLVNKLYTRYNPKSVIWGDFENRNFEILKLRMNGIPVRKIAKKYNKNVQTIYSIVNSILRRMCRYYNNFGNGSWKTTETKVEDVVELTKKDELYVHDYRVGDTFEWPFYGRTLTATATVLALPDSKNISFSYRGKTKIINKTLPHDRITRTIEFGLYDWR